MRGKEHPPRGEEQSRPILCRNLQPDVSRAIDTLVYAGIYNSRDKALAELAAEGLRYKIESSPTIQELLSVAERFRELSAIVSSSRLLTQQKQE